MSAQDSALVRPLRPGIAVTLSGLFQADVRLIANGGAASGPIIRRAEVILEAAAPRGFSLRVQPDFGLGLVLLQDALVRWSRVTDDSVTVRLGRFRPSFGTERFRASATLLFPERSMVNAFVLSRAMGADVRVTHGAFVVQAAVFQPPLTTTARVIDTDGDVQHSAPARQEALLRGEWRLKQLAGDGNVRVHAGVVVGTASGQGASAVPMARILTAGQQPIFEYRATGATPVMAAGSHWRADVGLESIGQRLAWHVEAVQLEDGVRTAATARNAVKGRAFGASWNAVTGGVRGANWGITPTSPRGAIEWGVRASVVRMDRDAVRDFAEPGSAASARSAGVAISWLPSHVTRMTAAYDLTDVVRTRHRREQTVILRVQQMY